MGMPQPRRETRRHRRRLYRNFDYGASRFCNLNNYITILIIYVPFTMQYPVNASSAINLDAVLQEGK